ncbi:MAG: ATP-binding protein [Planctomycetaceae bacterium]|nr:ATP-binding protein [Planctomycetaceae bacterium]
MSILGTVIESTSPSAPKGIIYGPPGIGKTTFGATADASLIVDCENGAGAISCNRTPYLATWHEIGQWLLAIERDQHSFRTLVIDSIDWLLRRLEEHVAGSSGKIDQTLNRSHGGYGAGKQVLKNYVYQQLLPTLDRIVGRGIAVVLLAHAKRTEITDVDGITREKTTADLPDDFRNIFVEWSDFVCLAKQDHDGNRVLVTTETPAALAKNRYGMPPTVAFEWPSFIDAVSQGLSRTFAFQKSEA